jgi:hypothetical protein
MPTSRRSVLASSSLLAFAAIGRSFPDIAQAAGAQTAITEQEARALAKGPFNLIMRLYAPKSDALTRKWNPPPVMRL